jgi:3-methylcrotonyl-CoA carboxylase alpha subunit
MFAKLLVANRGEIACRIIRTARRLGIHTVAVYSEADAGALHPRLADEAVNIGPPESRRSYLDIDKILDAAMSSGAVAIHPGYGFLSENGDFAERCSERGLVFVGPPAQAIHLMGLKATAKTLLAGAGVPLIPGYHGENQDDHTLGDEASRIGYPLIIKASAGGGGKGMRLVERSDDFAAALASCRREALAAFANDHLILERYLQRPRHIEMQIFADSHGHTLSLFERDCSVQRRHQKVMEEAPAPGMSETMRKRMGEAAVAAARAVGYVGAGTVEFMVEPDGAFYFLEMNTRLQVEHPVTEMITGLDLVEWQLRVAAGEPLPLLQEQLQLRGHAMEARIYAEDPERDFVPSAGRLLHFSSPQPGENVRVDSGVEEGDDVSVHYDPLLAKLVVWGEDRETALVWMRRALAEFRVVGVITNIAFLSRLTACPAFAMADLSTSLIKDHEDLLFPPVTAAPPEVLLVAAVGELLAEQAAAEKDAAASADPWSPWHHRDGWLLNLPGQRTLRYGSGQTLAEVLVDYGGDHWRLTVHGDTVVARGWLLEGHRFTVELDQRRAPAFFIVSGSRRHVVYDGRTWVMERHDPLGKFGQSGGPASGCAAPMPGKVISHLTPVGARVEKGTALLILEAMKMEQTLVAPKSGLVKGYFFAEGDQVREGELLVDFLEEG